MSTKHGSMSVMLASALIFVAYFCYGLLQEKLTSTRFETNDGGTERFTHVLFLLFVQCVVNASFAYLGASLSSTPGLERSDQVYFAPVAFIYIAAMYCSNLALIYIDYPTQVVAKSCKPLAVMFVTFVTRSNRMVYTRRKFASVFMMTLGILLFFNDKVRSGTGEIDDSMLPLGRMLIGLSLLCDGVTAAGQERLIAVANGGAGVSSWHMMLYFNVWSSLFVLLGLLMNNELWIGLAFFQRHANAFGWLLLFALSSAVGQSSIYYIIRHHSTLLCTIVTTMRKFFTVLISIVVFRHTLASVQMLGVSLVFGGLFMHNTEKKPPKKETKSDREEEEEGEDEFGNVDIQLDEPPSSLK